MFALNVFVNSPGLESIKADLIFYYPEIKSSHRCEALARGLGFRTYASLLAQLQTAGDVSASASGAKFGSYLKEHGFDAKPDSFYWAVARLAIAAVMRQEPKLTSWGYGIGPRERNDDGTRVSSDEHQHKFDLCRKELLGDAEEFLQALSFLSRLHSAKNISTAANSYSLKHMAEEDDGIYPDGETINTNYVSNGALIAAAIHSGYRYRTHRDGLGGTSLNVSFNMPTRLVHNLDRQIRGR